MTYKLFVDSDVLLDILLMRQPHFNDSVQIFLLRRNKEVELYTSPSIIINTNYIAQRQHNKVTALKGVIEILKFVEIMVSSKKILVDCFNSHYSDVEDAIQYFTALQNTSIDYYITRNIKHFNFKKTNLPVHTPTQFLKILKQNS